MNPTTLIESLKDASCNHERAQKLLKIAHGLTISTREFNGAAFSGGESMVVRKLLGINEIQHRLVAQIIQYLAGEEVRRYPDDVFCRMLYDIAANHEIVPYLDVAVQKAI